MTVIGRKHQKCEYPSNNVSDVESLDLHSAATSDTESNLNEVPNNRHLKKLPILLDECLCRRGYLGKRKRRQVINKGYMMQTLIECEDFAIEFVQLMDSYKTPFERLMEDKSALQFWNEFNELSEENQYSIINPNKESRVPLVFKQEDVSPRISSKVKRAMKIKKNIPFQVIEDIENAVLDHFKTSPFDLYTSSPKNSFDRLMLHAIAQYHNLQSIGVNEIWPPCIQVFSSDKKWEPTTILFYDSIRLLRKQ